MLIELLISLLECLFVIGESVRMLPGFGLAMCSLYYTVQLLFCAPPGFRLCLLCSSFLLHPMKSIVQVFLCLFLSIVNSFTVIPGSYSPKGCSVGSSICQIRSLRQPLHMPLRPPCPSAPPSLITMTVEPRALCHKSKGFRKAPCDQTSS